MKRLYAVILLALALYPAHAQRKSIGDYVKLPQNRQLVKENLELRARLDSLQAVIDSLSERRYIENPTVLAMLEGNDDDIRSFDYSTEVTDSLINVWYESNKSSDFESLADCDMDSVRFSSDVSDEVMMQRLSDMNSFIPLPFNGTVKNYMIMYAEKMKSKMGRVMGLSRFYFPIFEEKFAKYGIPMELKYMAVVESMLSPTATSRAGAKGMWQFMYVTARGYGLNIDSFVDERLDVEKAADAAARYLKDAYNVFGDWSLAISSYNCGAGNVNKAIRRADGKRDFWSIYDYLPRETRGYVPAFVGAMYAMTYYREYGIQPQDVGMPAQTDTFEIRRKLHFRQINEVVGVPMQDLQQLNPQYYNDIIPGTGKAPCVINLPYNWTAAFMESDQDSLYLHRSKDLLSDDVIKDIAERNSSSRPSRIAYRVKSGDYLGRIATKYHCSVKQIKTWNHLRSDTIRAGQVLYIYP